MLAVQKKRDSTSDPRQPKQESTVTDSVDDYGSSVGAGKLSPHFRGRDNRAEGDGHNVRSETLDGDELVLDENSSGAGLRVGGVRYLRPTYIGRSFATTQDGDHDQDFFVARQNLNFQ